MKPILNLTIRRKWLDMIASGEKREEYRHANNAQVLNFWRRRFNGWQDDAVAVLRAGYTMRSPAVVVEVVDMTIRGARVVQHPEWGEERDKLIAHEQSFAEVLIRHNLYIRSDLLSYCANWVTPLFSPKRFDTFFFAALCPEGQTPDDCSTEASIADWVDPQWAFDLGDAGEIILLPPTIYNLNFVYRAKNLDELLHTDREHIQFMEEGAIDENGDHVVTGILP